MGAKLKDDYIVNITKRYVYDVVRHMPENQRQDIEKELETLIDDMLHESVNDGEVTEKDIHCVLEELGKPADLADKYCDKKRCLISGANYDNYFIVLGIVLASVILSQIVSGIVNITTGSSVLSNPFIIENFSDIVTGSLIGFAWVTIIFACIERGMFKSEHLANEAWNVSQLPKIPRKEVLVKRCESIVGLGISILLISIVAFFPHWAGIWLDIGTSAQRCIPIFNIAIWPQILPVFVAWGILEIAKDSIKMVMGKYNNTVLVTTIITSVSQLVLTFVLFVAFPIWNPNFIQELQNELQVAFDGSHDILRIYGTSQFESIILAIIIVAVFLEIGTAIWKTLQYNRAK